MTCRFNRARTVIAYTVNVEGRLLIVAIFIVADCIHIVATDRIPDIEIGDR